ncbi:MAG TPA: protoporphyrinogen oxidase [Patescibacteria group bacterium]|nr:protoporphyrinogen oxidase [Patescibacteria group bacterium]
MPSKKIIILGAGISGLSCAYFLKKRGADVTILEASAEAGGAMQSRRIDGFLVERGPNSTQETTPLFDEIIRDLKLEGERIYAEDTAKYRYILRDGELHAMPLNPSTFLKTKLFSLKAKMRLLAEPFIGKAEEEESIAQFVERRLGRELLEYAINPFVAGIYAGDPKQLSLRHAFPKLSALEENYGGLFKGMLAKKNERGQSKKEKGESSVATQPAGKMFSFKNGMGTLSKAIADSLGDNLHLNSPVEKVFKNGEKFIVQTPHSSFEADEIVLALPAYAASDLLKDLSQSTAVVLKNIVYPPVCEVVMGFKIEQVERALDGFGFLIPEKENRKILGCIWSSSIFKARAPEGFVELTTFVGGTRNSEIAREPDDVVKRIVAEELRELLKISGDSAFTHILRWERAIPQYQLGYGDVLKALDAFEKENRGMFFCSNFRGGVSVGDCVKSGFAMAERILNYQK